MRTNDFGIGDRVCNVHPVRFYRWTNPEFSMNKEKPELWDFFRGTEYYNDRVPPGTVVEILGGSRDIYTELVVLVSSHPGLKIGDRVIVMFVDNVRWKAV